MIASIGSLLALASICYALEARSVPRYTNVVKTITVTSQATINTATIVKLYEMDSEDSSWETTYLTTDGPIPTDWIRLWPDGQLGGDEEENDATNNAATVVGGSQASTPVAKAEVPVNTNAAANDVVWVTQYRTFTETVTVTPGQEPAAQNTNAIISPVAVTQSSATSTVQAVTTAAPTAYTTVITNTLPTDTVSSVQGSSLLAAYATAVPFTTTTTTTTAEVATEAATEAATSATSASSSSGSGGSGSFSGQATYYAPGLGACGQYSTSSDLICALSHGLFDSEATANPNNNPFCGRQLKITYQGQSVVVTAVDRCEGCSYYDVDLSPAAFAQLAPQSLGRIDVTWEWV